MLTQKSSLYFLWFVGFIFLETPTAKAQQSWETSSLLSSEYFFASNNYGSASQWYQIQPYFPNLGDYHVEANFYTLAAGLRSNTAGAEKMLTAFMIDHPTSYLTETAFFDAANFYFNKGKYSYALKWYNKISEKEVAKVQRSQYNFNKGYAYFASKRYKNAKPLFEKIKDIPAYQGDANYYLGYIAYQLEDFDEANRNFEKLNQRNDDNTIGYFQADMNFKLGRFQEAILLARKSLKGADDKETSELSKIIGESYFNLKDYRSSIPYLLEYDGKKRKWNNTDYYQLGYAYYRIKEYQKAIDQFNRIITTNNAVAQNAYYHLADSYLKTDQKTAALNAFKRASEMNFDAIIKEDALFNYAKLSYEIGNSYENPSAALRRFIDAYPKNEQVNKLEALLLDSYVTSKNFDAALLLLDKFSSNIYDDARQKVTYMKATSLYKSGQYLEAIDFYTQSIKAADNSEIIFLALYWKGQAQYELNQFENALETFLALQKRPTSLNTYQLLKALDYPIGYCYFQLKNYPLAIQSFKNFIRQNPDEVNYERDARLRMGDSHFILKTYWPAMDEYEKATALNPQKGGYAMYQQALSYGFVDRVPQKIELLQKIIRRFPSSPLKDDCVFELALSYAKQNQNVQAISMYDQIISNPERSPYRSKSLLNKGLIQYNLGQTGEANATLKSLVENFPTLSLSQQALQTVKEIAVEENTVDELSEWLNGLNLASVPDLKLEKAAFDAIERLLDDGKKKALQKALVNYVENYPGSSQAIRAHFLLAELAFEKSELDAAVANYSIVVSATFNTYTEQSLVRLTQSLNQLGETEKAFAVLLRIENEAENDENKRYALANIMQYYAQKENHREAIKYAEKVITYPEVEEQLKWDAYYITAKSAEAIKDLPRAAKAFEVLEKAPQGERAVEALYFSANQKHQNRAYAKSNKVIEKIAEDYGGYPEWGAKSLLLMAMNFYQLDDAFQATFILTSILENFTQFPEVVNEAQKNLDNIKMVEAKNNSSVNLEEKSNE